MADVNEERMEIMDFVLVRMGMREQAVVCSNRIAPLTKGLRAGCVDGSSQPEWRREGSTL